MLSIVTSSKLWLGRIAGFLIVLAPAASAQGAFARSLSVGVGVAFPSGGDLNDTYAAGPTADMATSFVIHGSQTMRLELDDAEFRPARAPHHTDRDAHTGHARTVAADLLIRIAPSVHLVVGAGATRVAATWLNARNVVEPYSTSALLGWRGGF